MATFFALTLSLSSRMALSREGLICLWSRAECSLTFFFECTSDKFVYPPDFARPAELCADESFVADCDVTLSAT
jgi:hypothetical protein